MRSLGFFLGCVLSSAAFAQQPADAPLIEPSKPMLAPVSPEPSKSFLVPALEVPLFNVALSLANYLVIGEEWTHVSLGSIERNLTNPWVWDVDGFWVNQFGHPYQGSFAYTAARSSGWSFWQSAPYALASSFLWEVAGETEPPSINDLITTPVGGSLLGEALYRISLQVLDYGGENPGFWWQLGSALASPVTAMNRALFGTRARDVSVVRAPSFGHFWAGANFNGLLIDRTNSSVVAIEDQVQGTLGVHYSYGLPGDPSWTYDKPFDYFDLRSDLAVSERVPFANLFIRGSLIAWPYSKGDTLHGMWGLYGLYDFATPATLRASVSATGLGSTTQWRVDEDLYLQGTGILAAVLHGSAGTVTNPVGFRDFHAGPGGEAFLELKAVRPGAGMLRLMARHYFIVSTYTFPGTENITYATASLNFRLFGNHAVGIEAVAALRRAHYPETGDRFSHDGSLLRCYYTFLTNDSFGAVSGPGQ